MRVRWGGTCTFFASFPASMSNGHPSGPKSRWETKFHNDLICVGSFCCFQLGHKGEQVTKGSKTHQKSPATVGKTLMAAMHRARPPIEFWA